VLSVLLIFGTKESAWFNGVVTVLHVVLVVFIIIAGLVKAKPSNAVPFLPFGAKGAFNGASIVFFSYIGFDAVACAAGELSLRLCSSLHARHSMPLSGSNPNASQPPCSDLGAGALRQVAGAFVCRRRALARAACLDQSPLTLCPALLPLIALACVLSEETKNPRKDLPRGILGSVSIVTVLYTLMAITLALMVPREDLLGFSSASFANVSGPTGSAARPQRPAPSAVAAVGKSSTGCLHKSSRISWP
jgi:hypothetical protein